MRGERYLMEVLEKRKLWVVCNRRTLRFRGVTADLFSVWDRAGVGPNLPPDEDKPTETGRVVVRSSDCLPAVSIQMRASLNKQISLNGHQYTVVGVIPTLLSFPSRTNLWTFGPRSLTMRRAIHRLPLSAGRTFSG
jgi:hypothetical protein